MEFTDYAEAKKEIERIKKSVSTATANLAEEKDKDEPDKAEIKKRKATLHRFESQLKNAEKAAEKVRPGFWKRTGTWVVFGVVTLIGAAGAGAAYVYFNQGDDEDNQPDDGNGDEI